MRRMINEFFSRCHLHLQQRQTARTAEKAVVIRPDANQFHGKSQMRQIQQNTPTVLSRLSVIVLAAESLLLALDNSTPAQSA